MPHILEKRDRWGRGTPVWVLAIMVALLPPSVWALRKLEMHNDVTSWLPADDPQAVTLRKFQETFPTRDRILLSWQGSGLSDPRLLQLAVRLEGIPDSNGVPQGGSPYVAGVLTPQMLMSRMKDVPLQEAIQRLEGVLVGRGPLRVSLSEAGRRRGRFLFEELRGLAKAQLDIDIRRVDTTVDASWVPPSLPPLELEPQVEGLHEYLASEPLSDMALRWPGMQSDDQKVERFIKLARAMRGAPTRSEPNGELLITDCFFFVGSPAALAVELTEAGTEDSSEAIAAIRDTARAVGIDPAALHMGGRMIAANELNQAVKRAGWNTEHAVWDLARRSPMLLSFLVTVILSFFLLRSVRLAMLVMLISLYTVILAVAIVPITGGSMDMVLVVMPTLLMVLTTSAGIHLANYWRHAASEGEGEFDNVAAIVKATRTAARPCVLAALTTAIGLLSLCTSTLVPVRHFGMYSAIGCVLSLLGVLFALPTLMMYWPARRPAASELRRENWNRLGRTVCRFATPVILVCVVLGAVTTSGLSWFRTETKVIRYFPEHSRIVKDYRFLEENLSGIVPVDAVIRFDADGQRELNFLERMELVRRIQTKIARHTDVSGVISLATFQPETPAPPANARTGQKIAYRAKAKTMQSRIHDALAAQRRGGKDYSFSSLIQLDSSRKRNPDATPDELWRVSAQVAIMTDLDYGELMDDLNTIARSELRMVGSPGTNHVVTGLVPVFLRTQQAVLESLIRSFGLAFAVIAIVMMVLLRNPLAGLITMIPNLLPVFAVFGLISHYGVRIDIGTMITASVALGIAVDGTLHLLTWFRKRLEAGDSRTEAVCFALEHCGPAMLQTSAAIGLGMLTLIPVELLLISRFGWLMATLIAVALLADIVLLPALLSGFLGRLIERGVERGRDLEEADTSTAPESTRLLPRPHVVVDDESAADPVRHRAG